MHSALLYITSYTQLVLECTQKGWRVILCPVEVGSRGFISNSLIQFLTKVDFLHKKGRKPSVKPQKLPVEVQHGSGRSTMKLLRHPSSNPHHSPPGGSSAVALLAHPPLHCLEVNGQNSFGGPSTEDSPGGNCSV